MDFSQALNELKNGRKLTRIGWNGKGMFIYLVPKGNYPPTTTIAKELTNHTGHVPYQSYIAFKTADGTVVPWTASQTDLLEGDWVIGE